MKKLKSRKTTKNIDLFFSTIQFGVISSEAIAEKTVYVYSGSGEFSQPIHFETLTQPESEQKWEDNYRHLTSTLVTSSLLTSNPKSSSNPKPGESKPQSSKAIFTIFKTHILEAHFS